MTKRIPNQPWPQEPWAVKTVGTQPRIFDAKGNDITTSDAARERMIACVNGFAGVWLVETNVQEATDHLRRSEAARKAASDRVGYLEGVLNSFGGDPA
jgi:hypothetical protein